MCQYCVVTSDRLESWRNNQIMWDKFDDTFWLRVDDCKIKIKYCPFCGEKLDSNKLNLKVR